MSLACLVSSYHLLILILIVLEAQQKKEKKIAAEEKARACKENQAKNQAKAAECERRRNQEKISKILSTSPSTLLIHMSAWLLALDTRQYGEDKIHIPTAQDSTVDFHSILCSLLLLNSGIMQFHVCEVPTGIKAAPMNLVTWTSKIPLARTIKAGITTKLTMHDSDCDASKVRPIHNISLYNILCHTDSYSCRQGWHRHKTYHAPSRPQHVEGMTYSWHQALR